MTHAAKVREAEAAVVEAAIVSREAVRREQAALDEHGPDDRWDEAMMETAAADRREIAAVDALLALRAATCPACGGTGEIVMPDKPGVRTRWMGSCPAGCDAGRKREV